MRWIIFLVLALTWTRASLAMRVSLFILSGENRYTENENREQVNQSFRNFSGDTIGNFKIHKFSGALTFEKYQFGLETFDWQTSSDAPLIGFYENRRELHTTHLFKMGEHNEWLNFFSGFGIGAYEIDLTNQFNGATSKTKSGQIMTASGIASIQAIYKYFHATADLKLLFAKDYRPQPVPVLGFKIGFSF
ncbi:MAG: hypothetical protein JNL11_13190 [Bdellovibrionaceae bacterium]|nr:hypothetical protein [Pseudobdellovibrionaceae bacterium]